MLVPQKRPFPVRKRETRDGRREENTLSQTSLSTASQKRAHLWRRMVARKYCYLMLIPVAAYFIIFCYIPMYGLLISFQDYKVFKGIWGSEWVGLQNFRDFVNGRQFCRSSVIRCSPKISGRFLIFIRLFSSTFSNSIAPESVGNRQTA